MEKRSQVSQKQKLDILQSAKDVASSGEAGGSVWARDSQAPPSDDYLFHDPEYPIEAYAS